MPQPQYPKNLEERAKLYLHCMAEIKLRMTEIERIGRLKTKPLFVAEMAYLHLRFICELIAIACLAAQGDFKTQRAFAEDYRPPKIFKALRAIYPDFFPQPATLTTEANEHHLKANAVPNAYGEDDVTSVWHEAGDVLHRTSADKYLKKSFKSPPPLAPIQKHLDGLIALLNGHIIPVSKAKGLTMLHVVMDDGTGHHLANWLHFDEQASTVSIEQFRGRLVD